ncbi:MAG TPA: RDD family protein [Gammaproteobacteria bacterium]|nr:RDD family protein [Gammaproteobacteria bacterium]
MPAVETDSTHPPTALPGVPLWRRLAAACYDGLIVLALWFIATALVMPISREAVSPNHAAAEFLYRLYLLTIGYAFFAGFWVRDGQTVGMLAWRVKLLQSANGDTVTWKQAVLRYLAALLSWAVLGAGFWWALFDPERKTWHDWLSGTELALADPIGTVTKPKS